MPHTQNSGQARRIRFVKLLEETDEFARAMAVLHAGMNAAGQQVDPGEQAQRSMALVFMVSGNGRMNPRLWRQVRRGVAERVNDFETFFALI
jgi:hypothetical protein